MPPAHFSTVLIAIALWVAPCLAAGQPAAAAVERRDAAPGGARPNAGDEHWRNSFTATVACARALLEAGYGHAPALVIALGAFVVLPAVALVSFTDLSGKGGNGIRVNGERQARAQLADGDVIELGRTRLKFESAHL